MYLLDTNIIVLLSRRSNQSKQLLAQNEFLSKPSNLFLSIVTLGELNSLALQRGYNSDRIKRIDELISGIAVLDISHQEVINAYGQIDAFSQGKLTSHPSAFTARNMGKNDLWIAATAAHYGLTLVTADKDFDHLKDSFFKLEYIDLQAYK